MAISFVGSAANSASPNGTFAVTLPVGCEAGDLIVGLFAVGDSPGADNDLAVTGYTEVADLAITTDTNDTEMWVGYRYFVAGDTAMPTTGTFTALGGTNASNAACVMVFRGVASAAQGGPFTTTSTTATGIDTSNADPPSIATTASDWVVIAGSTGHTGGASATYTAPTGYTTDFVQRAHNDTVDVLVGMGYRSTGISNPEDPGVMTAATIGTASANSWCAVTMALKAGPVAHSLACDGGSYSVTGATILPDIISPVSGGSYSLTGTAAELRKSIIMAAESGSYSVTGQGINAQLVVPVASGSYSVAGSTITSTIVMVMGGGTYLVTGQDVTLTHSGGGGEPEDPELKGKIWTITQIHWGKVNH
jgi:hypothetical protein